jgi:hypothetical protein
MTQEIHLVQKVDNGDGNVSMIAELCVYKDGVFSHHNSRSHFMFADTMTDQEIIDHLMVNEYSRYF